MYTSSRAKKVRDLKKKSLAKNPEKHKECCQSPKLCLKPLYGPKMTRFTGFLLQPTALKTAF